MCALKIWLSSLFFFPFSYIFLIRLLPRAEFNSRMQGLKSQFWDQDLSWYQELDELSEPSKHPKVLNFDVAPFVNFFFLGIVLLHSILRTSLRSQRFIFSFYLNVWYLNCIYFILFLEREYMKDVGGRGYLEQASCPAWSHNPKIMIWPKIKSQMLNWLSHPGAPQFKLCIK